MSRPRVPYGTVRNRPEPPATVELFWCAYCGGSALGGPDEVFHLNKRCPGKDDVSIVMRVTLRPESIEPCGWSTCPAGSIRDPAAFSPFAPEESAGWTPRC